MASVNYALAQNSARRMIARAGMAAKLLVPGGRTGPEWNPTVAAPTEHDLTVVLFGVVNRDQDSSALRSGDREMIASVGTVRPEPGHSLRLNEDGQDVTYDIVMVEPLSPAGIDVYTKLWGRR